MPSVLELSESRPLHAIQARASQGFYQSHLNLGQLVTAPIGDAEFQWLPIYHHGTTDDVQDQYIEEVMEVPARIFATQKWRRLVLDPRSSVDVDAISETVDAVYEAIDTYGSSFISFENLDPQTVQGEHLAAALRATSPWRAEVPGWHSALGVAKAALTNSGVSPDDALYGLIDNE
jgi:hypothetical protein